MPKFLPVQLDAAGQSVRQIYADYQNTFGTPPDNLTKTLAPSSLFLQGYYAMYRAAMGESSLNDKVRELAILKVAKLNGCKYSIHHHSALGRRAGVTDQMLASLDDHEKSDLFTYMEKEALSWAEGVTKNPGEIDEELFKQLKNHFTQQQVVELTILAAFFNMVARLSQSLDVEVEGQKRAAGHE
jgi:uncharacterized peroxidase-related enzyme